MLNVLIIDDEPKVGLLVKNLIEWDRLGLTLLSILHDGQLAYEEICKKKPNIVITDIQMPNLSGLQIIQKITEQHLFTHFIVISGYQYFEYAQQAIKFGVEDYLLKPIDEDELNKILEKIVNRELSKQLEIQHLNGMKMQIDNSKEVLGKEFFRQVEETTLPQDIQSIRTLYGIDFQEGLFLALVIKLDTVLQNNRNEEQTTLIFRKLSQIVTEDFSMERNAWVSSVQDNKNLFLVLNYSPASSKAHTLTLEKLFFHMQEYMRNFESYTITGGMSEEKKNVDEIILACREAKEALAWKLWKGTGNLLKFMELPRYAPLDMNATADSFRDEFKNAVETYDLAKIQTIVIRSFSKLKKTMIAPSSYYLLAVLFLTQYQKSNIFPYEIEQRENLLLVWKDKVEDQSSIEILEQYVCTTIVDDLQMCLEKKQTLERKPILKAIDYIYEHYQEKLTLEKVANQVGFNANYFSELFKKETGKNFVTYLTGIRMEEAKKMLRDSNDAIYQIAKRVGYADSKYFSQQFFKTIGVNPVEYRKLYN